jgi:drug/metabolite transporter (DMT)-like permease
MLTSKPSGPPMWRVIAAFVAVYTVWGSSYLGIRIAMETLPPFLVSGIRMTSAGILLYVIARRSRAARPTNAQWRSGAILGFLMFFVANGCLMMGQKTVASGMAATLYATVPLWFALLGWLWLGGKRPGGRVIFGLLMGLVGIGLLVGLGGADNGAIDPFGALLVLISAASWAIGSLLSKRLAMPESPFLGAAMNLFCGGLMLVAVSLITGEPAHVDWAAVSLRSVVAIAYLAVGSSVIAFGSYMWLLTKVSPNRLGTYAYVNPVVAVFLGWALVGEPLKARTLIAAVVIIGAVFLITTANPKNAEVMDVNEGAEIQSRPTRIKAFGTTIKSFALRVVGGMLTL